MKISEKVRQYWATKLLKDKGYKLTLSNEGLVRDDDDFKVTQYNFCISDNGYKVVFKIQYVTFIFEDGSEDNGWFIYDDGEMINEEVDFTDDLDNCIESCIYYFHTRY